MYKKGTVVCLKKEVFYRAFKKLYAIALCSDYYDYAAFDAVQQNCKRSGVGCGKYKPSFICRANGRYDGGYGKYLSYTLFFRA